MNQLVVPQGFGPISTVFAGQHAEDNDDLSAGVHGGFGIVGYKGKVWSLRKGGVEYPLMRPNNEGPYNSIELVIIKSSRQVAKIFYQAGYVEGSTAAPDCFSTSGVTPDVSAMHKQNPTCANCPQNAWGSRMTPAGKQGKACSDSKRLAVVPLNDIKNETFGGPLLLRVPAASLQDLAQFAQVMKGYGYFYYAIGVRISFDPAESYPKFKFSAIRPLTNDEAKQVLELRNSPQVGRILSESEFDAPAQAALPAPAPSPFEQAPVTPVVMQGQVAGPVATAPTAAAYQPNISRIGAAPAPAPVQAVQTPMAAAQQAAPAPAAQPAPQVAPTPAVAPIQVSPQPAPVAAATAAPVTPGAGGFEDDFDAKLDALLPPS